MSVQWRFVGGAGFHFLHVLFKEADGGLAFEVGFTVLIHVIYVFVLFWWRGSL